MHPIYVESTMRMRTKLCPLNKDLVALVAAAANPHLGRHALPKLAAAVEVAYGPAGEAIGQAVRELPGVLEHFVAVVEAIEPGALEAL